MCPHLKATLAGQLGSNGIALANAAIEAAGGDVQKAYRRWLSNFIDLKFQSANQYFLYAAAAHFKTIGFISNRRRERSNLVVKKNLLILLATVLPTVALAAEKCQAKSPIKTQFGVLTDTTCSDEKGFTLRESISLDARKLLEDKVLIGDLAFDKKHAHWIYAGPVDPSTNCSSKIYMIDISVTPAAVFEFGVKDACNEYEWASWGKGESVISLKENVRFLYKNNKMIAPKANQSLLQTIQMPADIPDGGIVAEKLIPFANKLMEKPTAK